MRVWVPGGRGLLGCAVARRLDRLGVDAVISAREAPLHDPEAVAALLDRERPTHVLNCAAYTAVDAAESDPVAASLANAEGPAVLGRACASRGLPALHVSTDYVFSGASDRPWREDDPTGPVQVYGRTKLAGELAFARAMGSVRHHVVRTSWLFGREGRHFVGTVLRLLRERDEVRVVDDQRGRPTFGDHLAEACLALLGLDPGAPRDAAPGVFHVASAGETTWYGLARAVLDGARSRGLPLRCQRLVPIPTAEYPTPARRPGYSVLDTAKVERALGRPCPPWQAGLELVLDDAARETAT